MTTLVLALLLTTAAAKASATNLEQRKHRQTARLHADRGSLRFCRNHPRARVFCTPARLRFLRARVGWTSRELRETLALLNPYRVPEWFRAQAECIFSHESGGYGWHANSGNGYQSGLQFLPSTWVRAGGRIDGDGNFYYASKAEIIFRAWVIVQSHHGSWSEWSTRGMCGLG